ncbi:unnamed protein product, partial [Polarella glacialis]
MISASALLLCNLVVLALGGSRDPPCAARDAHNATQEPKTAIEMDSVMRYYVPVCYGRMPRFERIAVLVSHGPEPGTKWTRGALPRRCLDPAWDQAEGVPQKLAAAERRQIPAENAILHAENATLEAADATLEAADAALKPGLKVTSAPTVRLTTWTGQLGSNLAQLSNALLYAESVSAAELVLPPVVKKSPLGSLFNLPERFPIMASQEQPAACSPVPDHASEPYLSKEAQAVCSAKSLQDAVGSSLFIHARGGDAASYDLPIVLQAKKYLLEIAGQPADLADANYANSIIFRFFREKSEGKKAALINDFIVKQRLKEPSIGQSKSQARNDAWSLITREVVKKGGQETGGALLSNPYRMEFRQPSCLFYDTAIKLGNLRKARLISEDGNNPCVPWLYHHLPRRVAPQNASQLGTSLLKDACELMMGTHLVASNSLFFKYLALMNENHPHVMLPVQTSDLSAEPFKGDDGWFESDIGHFEAQKGGFSAAQVNLGPWDITLIPDAGLDHFVPSALGRKLNQLKDAPMEPLLDSVLALDALLPLLVGLALLAAAQQFCWPSGANAALSWLPKELLSRKAAYQAAPAAGEIVTRPLLKSGCGASAGVCRGPPLRADSPLVAEGGSVDGLFLARARESPDAIALLEPAMSDDSSSSRHMVRVTTYRELEAMSGVVAQALKSAGIGDGDVVALLLGPSRQMLVASLGVMRAGAAWLPLDSTAPASRLRELAAGCGARVALVAAAGGSQPPPLDAEALTLTLTGTPVWALEDSGQLLSAGLPTPLPRESAKADKAFLGSAAVFYTSGSSGKPKAVIYGRDTLLHGVLTFVELCDVRGTSKVLVKSPTTWAVCEYEMFAPLVRGGTAVVDPASQRDVSRLVQTIQSHDVSVLLTSAPVLQMLAEEGSSLAALQHVVNCGAALPLEVCEAAQEALGAGVQIHNMYGCTETPCTAWTFHVGASRSMDLLAPAGRPMTAVEVHVLDDTLNSAGMGQLGEVCFGGRFLSRGYLGDPELTAQKFVQGPAGCGLIYRSGDLGCWIEDRTGSGEWLLQVQGRVDRQLNLRGIRVAPEEVEAVISQMPGVREAAVVGGQSEGSGCLVACVAGLGVDLQAKVHSQCKEKLPSSMCPAVVLVLDSLPKLGNGKIDLVALEQHALGASLVLERDREHRDSAGEGEQELQLVRDSLGEMRLARGQSKQELEVLSAARACAAAGIILYHWYWIAFSGGAGCWNGLWIQKLFEQQGPPWFRMLVWGLMMSSWKMSVFLISAAYMDRKNGEDQVPGQLRQEIIVLFLLVLCHLLPYLSQFIWNTLLGNTGYVEDGIHRWYLAFYLLCRSIHRWLFMPLLLQARSGGAVGTSAERWPAALMIALFGSWAVLGWPHDDDVPNLCRGLPSDNLLVTLLHRLVLEDPRGDSVQCPLFSHGREAVGYLFIYTLSWWCAAPMMARLRGANCPRSMCGGLLMRPSPLAAAFVASMLALGWADMRWHVLSPTSVGKDLLQQLLGVAQACLLLAALAGASGAQLKRTGLPYMGSFSLGAYAVHYFLVATFTDAQGRSAWQNHCVADFSFSSPSVDHGMLFFAYKNQLLIPDVPSAIAAIGSYPGSGLVKLAVLLAYPVILMLTLAPLFQKAYLGSFCLLELGLCSALGSCLEPTTRPVPGGCLSPAEAWRRWRLLRTERCDQGRLVCLDGGVGSEVERAAAAAGEDAAVHPE